MYKAKHDEVYKTNNNIYRIKKKAVNKYLKKLSEYEDVVSGISLDILNNLNTTSFNGHLQDYFIDGSSNSYQLGWLLNNPPELGDLSLPVFLGKNSLIDKSKQELVKLPKGYLYFSKDIVKQTYHVEYHLEKPDDYNPYLDANRTIKDTLPHIVRSNGLVIGQLYLVGRVLRLFKPLLKLFTIV